LVINIQYALFLSYDDDRYHHQTYVADVSVGKHYRKLIHRSDRMFILSLTWDLSWASH